MRDQTGPEPTGAWNQPLGPHASETAIDLYWLPLGAGGHFVRLNGRIYEGIQAYRERRRALDLYHSALEVWVPEGRYIIETAWPIPGIGLRRPHCIGTTCHRGAGCLVLRDDEGPFGAGDARG
jgi:hypothetical protein